MRTQEKVIKSVSYQRKVSTAGWLNFLRALMHALFMCWSRILLSTHELSWFRPWTPLKSRDFGSQDPELSRHRGGLEKWL